MTALSEAQGWLSTRRNDAAFELVAGGHWLISQCAKLDAELKDLRTESARQVVVDLTALEKLDTAGAWLISRTVGDLRAGGAEVAIIGARAGHESLIEEVTRSFRACPTVPERRNAWFDSSRNSASRRSRSP